jgi:hypothetical protein
VPDLAESALEFFDWPIYDFDVAIDVTRLDFAGAVSSSGGDGAAPVVTLVSPLTGFVEAFQAVVIDVTDNVGLGRVFVVADMPGSGREELVYRGDRFTAQYAAQSTQVAIAGGFRFTIKRSAGWPSSPTLVAYAVDLTGTTE